MKKINKKQARVLYAEIDELENENIEFEQKKKTIAGLMADERFLGEDDRRVAAFLNGCDLMGCQLIRRILKRCQEIKKKKDQLKESGYFVPGQILMAVDLLR